MAITSYKAVVGYYNSAGTPNISTAVTGQLSDGWIPVGSPILTDAYGQCTQMMVKTDDAPAPSTSAYTVVIAANPQPPDVTWDAQGEPLWIDTATYLQAYSKGSGYIRGVLPVIHGGTGATTAAGATTNIGAFAIANNLSEVTNRTTAWLNIRPTGALPLAADPVGDLDAATKGWVTTTLGDLDAATKDWVTTTLGDGYTAPHNTWTVKQGVATTPPVGTALNGGELRSDYTIAGNMHLRTSLRANGNYAQRGGAIWRVEDDLGNSSEVTFNIGGNVTFPVEVKTLGHNFLAQSVQQPNLSWPTTSPAVVVQLTNRVPNPGNAGGMFGFNMSENVGVDAFGSIFFIAAGANQAWLFNQFGNAIAPGTWVSNSDRRIKSDITPVQDPLGKMRKLRGYTWRRIDTGQFGIGYIAQEVQGLFPESVYTGPDRTMPDGTVVKGVLSPDTNGVAVGLHHEAILVLMDKIEALEARITSLESGK